MNFAHMVGEHQHESLWQGLVHTLTSWAGVILAILTGLIAAYFFVIRKKTNREDE